MECRDSSIAFDAQQCAKFDSGVKLPVGDDTLAHFAAVQFEQSVPHAWVKLLWIGEVLEEQRNLAGKTDRRELRQVVSKPVAGKSSKDGQPNVFNSNLR